MKFPTVIRLPIRDRNIWPTWVVTETEGGEMIHCHSEKLAKRVARALDLIEAVNGAGPEWIVKALELQARLDSAQSGDACIVSRGIPLPESEILTRAREAAVAEGCITGPGARRYASDGSLDGSVGIRAAARALRDLAKPLNEVVPVVVDPDLLEARRIAAENPSCHSLHRFEILAGEHDIDPSFGVSIALAAIRRGRELEREARSC